MDNPRANAAKDYMKTCSELIIVRRRIGLYKYATLAMVFTTFLLVCFNEINGKLMLAAAVEAALFVKLYFLEMRNKELTVSMNRIEEDFGWRST